MTRSLDSPVSFWRKGLFAALTVALIFGVAEGSLRLSGFHYQRVTTYLEFNYPRPGFLKGFFEIDAELLYRIRPTVKQRWVDLTWQPDLDLKIRDSRTLGPKPPGTLRLVALGDSSTYGVNTSRPWPGILEDLLSRQPGAGAVQVLNLGVPGYTAFQGRRLLESRGQRLDADVVILYFGWNDHLLALGFTDAEQKVGGRAVVSARNLLSSSRIYQAVSYLVARLRGSASSPRSDARTKRRVGLADYGADLRAMIDLAHSAGSQVIVCTYPTALGHLAALESAPPAWLLETHVDQGSLADLVDLQRAYGKAARQVAAETGAIMVDLEALFARQGLAGLFDDPTGDMIHPNDAGYEFIARSVAAALPERR